jgi:membrane protein DedA with SNARE-associated domain
MTPKRLDSATQRLKQGGPLSIGISILTPGVRSVAVVACGLAGIPLRRFILGLALGSGLFLALHFFLGYVGGSLLSSLGTVIPVPVLIGGIITVLLLGLGIWILIRRRQMPEASNREVIAQAVGAWHEATCPVCLALGAADRLQIHLPIEHLHHEHAASG